MYLCKSWLYYKVRIHLATLPGICAIVVSLYIFFLFYPFFLITRNFKFSDEYEGVPMINVSKQACIHNEGHINLLVLRHVFLIVILVKFVEIHLEFHFVVSIERYSLWQSLWAMACIYKTLVHICKNWAVIIIMELLYGRPLNMEGLDL